MKCKNERKKHRFKPTEYEITFLKYPNRKFLVCLECGSPNKTTKEEKKE